MGRSLTIDGDHLARLMKLCKTIGSGKGKKLPQLQRTLRASRRTLFRDFVSLADAGIRVKLGAGGYSISQNAGACKKALANTQMSAVNKLLGACLK